jgi:hypothetical protein
MDPSRGISSLLASWRLSLFLFCRRSQWPANPSVCSSSSRAKTVKPTHRTDGVFSAPNNVRQRTVVDSWQMKNS